MIPVLSVSNLTKQYGNKRVVNNLTKFLVLLAQTAPENQQLFVWLQD